MAEFYEKLVKEALDNYAITDFTTTFIRHNENISVKIENKYDNQAYLLRIHEPVTRNLQGIQHTLEGLNAEVRFLTELGLNADITLQRPVRNKAGSFISTVSDIENNSTVLCTLLTWIDGTGFGASQSNTEDIAYGLGELIARIHNFSCNWEPPQPFIRPVYDIDKYIHLAKSLVYGVRMGIYTEEQYEIVEQTMKQIKSIFDSTARTKENWGIIHGDLHGGNIIVNNNKVSPIDFCFSGYGYFLFDLGIALGSFKAGLRARVLEGYKALRNIDSDDYPLINACFILGIIGAFGFHINNTRSHEWIKRRMPYVTSEYCARFLKGESFILEID